MNTTEKTEAYAAALRRYLEEQDAGPADLARLAGLDAAVVERALHGEELPSARDRAAIAGAINRTRDDLDA